MITIDQKIAELLNNWNVDGWPVGNLCLCLIALVLSIILCGAIGIEREWRGRSAGLRTHLLVGVGSCIIMMISIYGFPASTDGHRDVARLAAQVITGVGFLGAGAIMHRSGGIKGLTTAGTIWIVMAIGIACGSFNFILAFVGTALIIAVLTIFKKVEVRINKHNPTICITVDGDTPVLQQILKVSKQFDCSVHGISTETSDEEGKKLTITYQAIFGSTEDLLTEYLSEIEKETQASEIKVLGHR